MEPLTDEQKVARVRRYLTEDERYFWPASDILGVAKRLGDEWHLSAFPQRVSWRLRAMRRAGTG